MTRLKNAFAAAAVAIAICAVGVAELAPKKAEAGDVWKATLSSSDGGCTQTVQINPQGVYCLQAAYTETCYKLTQWDGGTASASADCTKDPIIPSPQPVATTRMYPKECFESAGRTAVVACNLDAGVATTNLYLREKNKSADLAPHLP
jgi:hypothetical protein